MPVDTCRIFGLSTGSSETRLCSSSSAAILTRQELASPAAMAGFGHGLAAGLAAGAAGSTVGVGVSLAVPISGKLMAAGLAVLAAVLAIAAFLVVAYLLDRGDLKAIARRLRRPRAAA